MIKDASNLFNILENDFNFLFNPQIQELLQKAVTNLEALDNQALVLILSQGLVNSYQKSFENLDN